MYSCPSRCKLYMSHSHHETLSPDPFSWQWSFRQRSFSSRKLVSVLCPVSAFKLYIIVRPKFLATSFCLSRSSRPLGSSLLASCISVSSLILKLWNFQFISWARSVLGVTYNRGQSGFHFTEWHLVCASYVNVHSVPQRLYVFSGIPFPMTYDSHVQHENSTSNGLTGGVTF